MRSFMKKHEIALLRIGIAVLSIGMIVGVIAVSNPRRIEAERIQPEPPVPESRTRIVYHEIEVPYEVQAEPIYIKQYIEVVHQEPNRYSGIEISEEDRELMAAIVYHEARGECPAGQRMVAEVVLNRVLSDKFPDTISGVVYQRGQFTSAAHVGSAHPDATQREAVSAAIAETPITDEDVLFFSQGPYNDRIFCRLGGHVFCRG